MIEAKNLNQIINAVQDKDATIYVIATEELKKLIISGSDPVISSLPKEASLMLLEGKGMAVEGSMVMDWINGKIDIKNKRILDLCDIKVYLKTINVR